MHVDTPSIVQHRIVLAIFVAVVVAIVWWQEAADSTDYPVQKFLHSPVSDGFDKLDFTIAEAAWSDLQIDAQGNLKVDALTESALLDAIPLMNDQDSKLSMARMSFLLEKQFGAIASQQIMELLPKLKNYKEMELRWWEENGSRNPPPHSELFQLQNDLLGEKLATQMFSEQRHLLSTMRAIQTIRSDASLTEAEKNQALIDLQKSSLAGDASIE